MKINRRLAWEQLNQDIVNCTRCPRLVEWREKVARGKRAAYRHDAYWGLPVPGFGAIDPRLFIVGLAPGAHGSNRTGRMFTGDSAGQTLAAALYRAGLSNQPYSTDRNDNLTLHDAFLSALVRCVPPGNKPTGDEIANCRPFLKRELDLCRSTQVVLALGRVAFDGYLAVLRERGLAIAPLKPRHGEYYRLSEDLPVLAFSYHPSRQNTQTGRLTTDMLDALFAQLKEFL